MAKLYALPNFLLDFSPHCHGKNQSETHDDNDILIIDFPKNRVTNNRYDTLQTRIMKERLRTKVLGINILNIKYPIVL